MKNYTILSDIENLEELIREALDLKKENSAVDLGKGKTLGMLFFNPSLRTRLSTEKAAKLLGMEVMVMNADKDGWALEFEDGAVMDSNKAEHIKEAAAVLSQYCDIIAIRAFPGLVNREKDEQDIVINSFKKYASVPVVNLEGAMGHPLQALTDAITVTELSNGKRPKVVLTWAQHPRALPQAVPNSFVEVMKRMDVELVITNPEGYDLDPRITKQTQVIHDQKQALQDADFVYVKNWSSYQQYGQILNEDRLWTFDKEKLDVTNNAKVMHCLPVRRNVVISDEVLDSPNSIVIHQANNRTYAAQAVLRRLLDSGERKVDGGE